jgi:hypothetical protein
MHAGTAEPLRVSPPEAVAYLLELAKPVPDDTYWSILSVSTLSNPGDDRGLQALCPSGDRPRQPLLCGDRVTGWCRT